MRTLRLLCLLSVLLTVVLKSFRAVATQTCDSDDPNVVLTKAAYYEPGDDELIKCYLDHRKLDIETSDADKRTAMHHACLHGNVEVVRLLVERNAALDDQDKYGYTPVMWAAKGGYVEIVSYLLQRNVVLDSQDIAGYNALMHAVLFDRTEAAIAIIEEMDVKDMDAQEEEYGHTALHLSAFYGEHTTFIFLCCNLYANFYISIQPLLYIEQRSRCTVSCDFVIWGRS